MMIMKAKNLRAPAGRCLLTMALLFGLSDVSSAHPGDLVKSFGSAGTTTISVPMMDTVDFSSMFTVVDHDNRVLSAFRMTDSDR